MKRRILDSLNRQKNALGLLATLLAEEFSYLRQGNPQAVSGIELSVQDLLRQITSERVEMKSLVQVVSPGAARLTTFVQTLPEAERPEVMALLEELDRREQNCATLAAKNFELALALHDQSRKLLTFLHGKLNPEQKETYTAQGKFPKAKRGAAILQGRL